MKRHLTSLLGLSSYHRGERGSFVPGLLSALLVLVSRVPASAADALDIGSQRQVFIDGRFLARSRDVKLLVHQPVKTYDRTMEESEPWEEGMGVYSSVLYAEDRYHMWYRTGKVMAYATSRDGIKWEKPALGVVKYEGNPRNNIVLGLGAGGVEDAGEGGMVFLDPTAPPDGRYRMVIKRGEPPVIKADEPPDVCVFSSPDGIHWKLTHEHVLTWTDPTGRQQLDSQNVIFWDDQINKYVAYMRRNMRDKGPRYRTIARSESPTLTGFGQVQENPIVLGPDEYDSRFGAPVGVDYYVSAAIKYPWAQDAYYMFPTAYFHYNAKVLSEFPNQVPVNAGPLDTRFAASRDGVKWERYDRRPFIPLGMHGQIDSKSSRAFYGILPSVDGNSMYLYYIATDQLHGWPSKEEKRHKPSRLEIENPEEAKRAQERRERNIRLLTDAGLSPENDVEVISRVVLRRDGFVSVRADFTVGEFTTGLLKFSGRELVLNVDTSAAGWVRCELLDENDRPIGGFALDDCDVIHTANATNRPVSWKRSRDVSSLAGKPVRLRCVLQDADLYAFQFK